jgi:hypothetical protein
VKALSLVLAVPLLALGLIGCGGPDRTALASKTVSDYWYDIGHLKINQAYALLSPGVQSGLPKNEFRQNLFGFLQNTNGISAKVYKADVVGDCSLVTLGLITPLDPAHAAKVQQRLYWVQGSWRITDSGGYVSRTIQKLTSCPTGT